MDPAITAPNPGATLRGSVQVFEWDLGGIPIESAWLYAGSSLGGSQYGSRFVGSDTETSVGNLPTDGSTVFVRLWYRVSGQWLRLDEEYVAAADAALPAITDPTSGGRLDGQTHTFRWTFSGLAVEAAWLYVGSEVGGSDYAATFVGAATSTTVDGLPTDESDVFTRLYFRLAGWWYLVDDQFISGGLVIPDTDTLTRELQALIGVTADGDAGPRTRAALNRNWLGRAQSFDPSFAARFENSDDLIRWVQRRMNTRAGLGVTVSGNFDAATEAAVIEHLGRGGVVAVESYLTLLQPGTRS
jgi:hypothetical protein